MKNFGTDLSIIQSKDLVDRFQAVKMLRNRTGVSLFDAKRIVDANG